MVKRYKPTAETVAKREDQRGGYFDSIFKGDFKVYKVRKGLNNVRFLPNYADDAEHFGMDVWIHRNIGPDNNTYLCSYKMKGEPCSICDERRDLDEAGDTEAAKQISARRSAAYWLIDRDAEDLGPQLHMWGYTLDQDLVLRCKDHRTNELLDITDLEEGYDVSFRRGDDKPYPKTTGVEVDRQPSPLHDNEKTQDKWNDYVEDHPLNNDLLNFFDDEYIQNVLHGRKSRKDKDKDKDKDDEPRRGRDRDEDENPRSRRGRDEEDEKPKRSRDRDDEDEKPKRTRSRDDDDEKPKRTRDRDDEDEKPKRSRDRDRDDDDEKPRVRRERLKDDGDEDTVKQARSQLDKLAEDRGKRRPKDDDEEDEKPKRSRDRDDEDEKPRSRRGRDDDDDETPSRRRSRDETPDDDDETPRRRRERP